MGPAHLLPPKMQGEEPSFCPHLLQGSSRLACFLLCFTPAPHASTRWLLFLGQAPFIKLQCLSLPLLQKAFPRPGRSQATLPGPGSQTTTSASWSCSSLPGTYSEFNGAVLHALFP